jgi:hypothetical protein
MNMCQLFSVNTVQSINNPIKFASYYRKPKDATKKKQNKWGYSATAVAAAKKYQEKAANPRFSSDNYKLIVGHEQQTTLWWPQIGGHRSITKSDGP